MDSVLVGAVFVALFAFWWVKKAEWSRNQDGAEPQARGAVRPPLEVPPPAFREATSAASFRPDIEGLRAIAVLLVLVYHAKFSLFAGGFIGVDVFFVLSGFLITSLLLRELSSTGTISLANFWARRARRLLPASGLVLVATLIAGRFMLDGLSQAELARDAIAACAFVVNIRFAAVGTDYLTSQLPPSPLLHFWSLAVEEQFYMVWPGLLMVLVRFMRLGRRALGGVIGAMWVASFVACVWLTTRSQPWAFFMLPTRAWELLTGAALAFVGGSVAMRRQQRALLGWVGLLVIVVCGVVFSDSMRFPGWVAAIPVLATALVINAGAAGAVAGPFQVLRAMPLQWIGARSYAIYLWHFPMLILAEREWGPLSVAARLGILALSVVIAAISYQLVENPVRHSPTLAASPARSLAMGAWIALAGVGGAALLLNNPPPLDAGVEAAAPTLVGQTTTVPTAVGSTVVPSTSPVSTVAPGTSTTAARVPTVDASKDNPPELAALIAANLPTLEAGVQTSKVPSNLSPSLASARDDLPQVYDNGCILDLGVSSPETCIYGDPNGSVTVVLFGDSHAAEWMPAMHQVASQNGWRLLVHTKKACPTAEIPTEKDPNRTDCVPWREAVIQQIAQLQPDLVVMSAYRYKQVGAAAGRDPDQVWKEGLDLTVSKVRPLTSNLLLLGDSATPLEDVPSCLAGNLSSVASCMNSRDGAVRPGRLAVEREVAAKYDADFIPTSDWMCTDTACPVIVGNVLMYRDNSHITATASVFLAPYVDAALRVALG
ncbi:MAG: acyltransferase family protein [Actinobacteria bacterium]|nr:acyltransferase family protein [Actinomycetota bacterium]